MVSGEMTEFLRELDEFFREKNELEDEVDVRRLSF